jgi:hypothetical protein
MSRTPGPVEAAIRVDPCPRPGCQAPANKRCISRAGTPLSYSHYERYDLAKAAGRLPLEHPAYPIDRAPDPPTRRTETP